MIRTRVALLLATLLACSRGSDRSTSAPAPQPGATTTAASSAAPPESTPGPAPSGTTPPGTSPAAAATPGGAPGAAAVDAAAGAQAPAEPKGPFLVPVTSASAVAAAGTAGLTAGTQTVVDPGSRFAVEIGVALGDARLSLLDADDAMVAAAESHEIGSTWTRFTLVPDAPLRPGSKYVLRLDGATEREAHDSGGRAYQVTTWPVRVAGDPPPVEKQRSPSKGKRRR